MPKRHLKKYVKFLIGVFSVFIVIFAVNFLYGLENIGAIRTIQTFGEGLKAEVGSRLDSKYEYSAESNPPSIKEIVVDSGDKKAKLIFFGDMMLDRNVRILINKMGDCDKLFDNVRGFIEPYDLAVFNLEGAISDFTPVSRPGGDDLRFTFASSTAGCIARSGLDLASLANNHSNNFGKKGLDQTERYLNDAGVAYFGNPFNSVSSTSIPISIIKEVNGVKIAFVGFHELYYENFDKVTNEIKRIKNTKDRTLKAGYNEVDLSGEPIADFIVVYPHWGIEYQFNPSKLQTKLAHEFIDAGADIIIGAHPHIIQDVEKYNGKWIYYSLGNFIFDQYFSAETMKGMALEMELEKGKDIDILRSYTVNINNKGVSVENLIDKK